MKRKIAAFLFSIAAILSSAQEKRAPSLFSLNVVPGASIPIGESATLFGLGGSIAVSPEYRLPIAPWLYFGAELCYEINPFRGVPGSISVFSAGLGSGFRFDLGRRLFIKGGVYSGYYFGTMSDYSITSDNPFIAVGTGLYWPINRFTLGLRTSYRNQFGLYSGLGTSLGLSYEQPRKEPKPAKKKIVEGIQISDFYFEDIFPVFHKYYDDHPVGRVAIKNSLKFPITDIRVGFIIPQFMDGPKYSPSPAALKPAESRTIELFAILRPAILEITEATKVQAQVVLEYKVKGEPLSQSVTQTVRVLDRNAMTWQDDRRVAAFVTAKDPVVLSFSRNVAAIVREKGIRSVTSNLLQAIALHGALSLHGLSYAIDPKGSYSQLSMDKQAIDFLQFPRQTLEYKAGDCDDLCILYSALLESVGIDTAFITIPGHILIAASLGLSPEDAKKMFSHPDELIFRNDKSWLPIEVTERGQFLKAWQSGAKQWRENSQRKQAELLPANEAWRVYEPVGLPGAGGSIDLPPVEKIASLFQEEVRRFVEWEILERVAALQERLAASKNDIKAINELGVLYARYGLYDRAQAEFSRILDIEEYVPALVNQANVFYLQGQKEEAVRLYEKACARTPENVLALLGLARASHDLENYVRAEQAYAKLKKLDTGLARRFSYLEMRGEESLRSAEVSGIQEELLWEQE